MNIYRYDPTRRLAHLEDHGDLDTAPDEFFDGGSLEPDNKEEEKDTDILDISNEDVVYSCSLFKVRGESKIFVNPSVFLNHEDLNTDDIVYCGIILIWIGFGTAFELDNGSERIISPYLNSGTAR